MRKHVLLNTRHTGAARTDELVATRDAITAQDICDYLNEQAPRERRLMGVDCVVNAPKWAVTFVWLKTDDEHRAIKELGKVKKERVGMYTTLTELVQQNATLQSLLDESTRKLTALRESFAKMLIAGDQPEA